MCHVLYKKDTLVFLLNRPSAAAIEYKDRLTGEYFPDIYYSVRQDRYRWSNPKLFAEDLKTNFFDGPVSFANDFKLMCYSQMYVENNGRSSNGNFGIFFAEYKGGEWVNVRAYEYNDPEKSLFSPCLSPNGREMYFVANLDDSRGGLDIYVSRFARGKWSEPENLGDQINTPANERYPFYHPIDRLYFSRKPVDNSDDADIWYSNRIEGEWKKAEPLDEYNRVTDEMSIYVDEYFTEYFISRRTGGTLNTFWVYTDIPAFPDRDPIKKTPMKYRIRETNMDTIDYTIFDYRWVIQEQAKRYSDTVAGTDIIYQFPGPGEYSVRFDVFNKVTDTAEIGALDFTIPIVLEKQPVITYAPDTVRVGEQVTFDASSSYLPDYEVEDFFWNFGDGSIARGTKVTHTFEYEGNFEVVLGVREKIESRRSKNIDPREDASYVTIEVHPASQ
jgi:hypothetical protein